MKNMIVAMAALLLAVVSCNEAEPVWSPVGENIRTRWAAEVSPRNSHPEYPRPQMIRKKWASLNGLWNYAVSPASADEMPQPDGTILVPFCIESSLSGVGRTVSPDEALWYSREFTVPLKWRKDDVLLHFEAVDWDARVWINGIEACHHTGGYTSFDVNVTPYLVRGAKQNVTVKVLDATDNGLQPRGKQVSEPSGIWYTSVSGIWQSVWMEPVGKSRIVSCTAEPDLASSSVKMNVISKSLNGGEMLTVRVHGPEKTYEAVADAFEGSCSIVIDGVRPWSPEDPYLYDIDVTLTKNGKTLDEVRTYTAMRNISVVEDAAGHKRMALNGKPLFQYGPLDQGWWPDGLYTPPTDEAMRYDLKITKDLGFNMIRKHIKIEPSTWYRACDEMGILVWQDMPSMDDNHLLEWNTGAYTDESAERAEWPGDASQRATYYKEWGEIITARKMFPCIVVWVPFNEAWAQFDTRKAVAFTRSLDPTRLINPSSGGNFVRNHGGDIFDVHHYPNPEMKFTEASSVNVLGEYGGIGLPLEGHLWDIGHKWGYVEYSDSKEVTDEYVRFAAMLEPMVVNGVSAAVYTQTTDVEGEVNGLMTYDREIIKVDAARVKAANESVIAAMNR